MSGPAAAALEALFPPGRETSIEEGGATSLLERIAGGRRLTAKITVAGREPLSPEQQRLLRSREPAAWYRHGRMSLDGTPAADVTALVLPRMIPGPAREELGITVSGAACRPGLCTVPLGRALRGHSATRLQVSTEPLSGRVSPAGEPQALFSTAVVKIMGRPVALVTETVYAAFLDLFPPPWPGLPSGA